MGGKLYYTELKTLCTFRFLKRNKNVLHGSAEVHFLVNFYEDPILISEHVNCSRQGRSWRAARAVPVLGSPVHLWQDPWSRFQPGIPLTLRV